MIEVRILIWLYCWYVLGSTIGSLCCLFEEEEVDEDQEDVAGGWMVVVRSSQNLVSNYA